MEIKFLDDSINLDSYKLTLTPFDSYWARLKELDSTERFTLSKFGYKIKKKTSLVGVLYKNSTPHYLLKQDKATSTQFLLKVDDYMLSVYNSNLHVKANMEAKSLQINYYERDCGRKVKSFKEQMEAVEDKITEVNEIEEKNDTDSWHKNTEDRYLNLMAKKMLI